MDNEGIKILNQMSDCLIKIKNVDPDWHEPGDEEMLTDLIDSIETMVSRN